ncbi:cell wall-active antibiotics response protein LiaF [Brevibacillus daliensis]|uniref:cell wall-active antibiotics response protein LiaF n=1 Tax=Brevibacillus daliensis TaxID=2892995 RepID=UPI001E2F6885|nr:cell wall-active antibiotics response protein LiaF [Brevibacillus daliensis]
MKFTRVETMVAGTIIILVGLGLFLNNLGILFFSVFHLWPLLFLFLGYRFWLKGRKITGGILLAIGVINIFQVWFGVANFLGVIISLFVIYYGFRLLSKHSMEFKRKDRDFMNRSPEEHGYDFVQAEPKYESEDVDKLFEEWEKKKQNASSEYHHNHHYHVGLFHKIKEKLAYKHPETGRPFKSYTNRDNQRNSSTHYESQSDKHTNDYYGSSTDYSHTHYSCQSHSSLFGSYRLTSGRFELKNMRIWQGVGDVVIDLSRAMIPDGGGTLIIEGWVGDITVYTPIDLPVQVKAEVSLGDLSVLGHHQDGVTRKVMLSSHDYTESTQKVRIIVSLKVGAVNVKYI